jgi:hypothetical protein
MKGPMQVGGEWENVEEGGAQKKKKKVVYWRELRNERGYGIFLRTLATAVEEPSHAWEDRSEVSTIVTRKVSNHGANHEPFTNPTHRATKLWLGHSRPKPGEGIVNYSNFG